MVITNARTWTPYEQTQLARYGHTSQAEMTADVPVEYLTGVAEFAGWPFVVTPATLIPRIETEELVELVERDLLAVYPRDQLVRVIEVGTGCGALGLTLSLALSRRGQRHQVILSEVSSSALAVARINYQRLAADLPVKLVKSDLLGSLTSHGPVDVIVANLPYIPTGRLAFLPTDVTQYEPRLALDGGDDGAELIRRLLAQAPAHLKSSGKVWLEIDHTHQPGDLRPDRSVKADPDQTGCHIQIIRDTTGQPRFARVSYT